MPGGGGGRAQENIVKSINKFACHYAKYPDGSWKRCVTGRKGRMKGSLKDVLKPTERLAERLAERLVGGVLADWR